MNTAPESGSVSGLILVGGGSLRMGANKALLPVGGVPLIERVRRALTPLCREILLIANDAGPYTSLGLPIVPDLELGRGPLMGLYSGLRAARGELALLLACDMPFVDPDLLAHMIHLAPGYDVVIPDTADGLHPLHALYRRAACLPAIAAALAKGERRMISFFDAVRVRQLPAAELADLPGAERALMNVNTPEELAAARHILRRLYFDEEEA